MISKLTGTIAHVDLKYIVIDVGGVGYKVYTTGDTAHRTPKASNVTLWTYLAVRENALDLYGFTSLSELNYFELLITISGIGPKTALGVLNVASIEALDSAIRSGDTAHLVKVGGIGKKMAEKIVMELKDKVDGLVENASATGENDEHRAKLRTEMKSDADALEALKSLGYNHNEARDALKEVDTKIKDTSSKVKAALKILGR